MVLVSDKQKRSAPAKGKLGNCAASNTTVPGFPYLLARAALCCLRTTGHHASPMGTTTGHLFGDIYQFASRHLPVKQCYWFISSPIDARATLQCLVLRTLATPVDGRLSVACHCINYPSTCSHTHDRNSLLNRSRQMVCCRGRPCLVLLPAECRQPIPLPVLLLRRSTTLSEYPHVALTNQASNLDICDLATCQRCDLSIHI